MQPFKRQQFICSAREQCQETVNCCAHKQPHIKDERCVPRQCRYAPNVEDIDCVVFVAPVPVSVAVPAPVPVAPIAPVVSPVTITQVLAEKLVEPVPATTLIMEEPVPKVAVPAEEEVTQEINIKAAVKKQASSKKTGRKA